MGIEHPRWGAIMGIVTTTDVEAGDELFTYYGYSAGLAIPEDFPWYWEMKLALEHGERINKEKKGKQKKIKKDMQK